MPKKGYKYSKERNKKISESLKGNKRHLGIPSWNKGKKCPNIPGNKKERNIITRLKLSKIKKIQNKGKGNPNWKGGVTKLNHTIRNSFEYRLWIKYCMERDNFTCQKCKIVGGILEVHHIKSVAKIIQEYNIKNIEDAKRCGELWDLDNGITLCDNCHIKIDNYRKRRNQNATN